MPLESTALAGLMYADYAAAMPTANAAIRSNPTAGVLPHNVPHAMFSSIAAGFMSALASTTVQDAYTGVVGSSATAAPIPPVFSPGLIASEITSLNAGMAWAGTASITLSTILITSLFTHVASKMVIQMNPLPGAGPGSGQVNGVTMAPVAAGAFAGVFQPAAMASFVASGKFNVGDSPAGPVSPQITLLVSNLATSYGVIVGGTTAVVTYAGASAGSGPLRHKNAAR